MSDDGWTLFDDLAVFDEPPEQVTWEPSGLDEFAEPEPEQETTPADVPLIARTPAETDDTPALFDVPPPHRDYWWGMPEFIMNDCTPYFTVEVHFTSWDAVVEFAETMGVNVTRRTKSVWWKAAEVEQVKEWCYAE